MKNHQSSTVSKKKQRKVFIISLLLQNEEHRPLKIFPEQPPAKEKEEEKNCKKIQDTFLLSQNHKSSFNSFQEKNEKKRKQIKANPLEEQQSRNDDFPWCTHIVWYNIARPEGCSPYFESTRRRSVSSIWPFVSPRKYATMPSLCAARLSSMFAK